MGNSQQKAEEIEKFHQQKLQQIQGNNTLQQRVNGLAQNAIQNENTRMIRSHSTPLSSQFRPSITHIAVIRQPNQNIVIQNSANNRPRSTSLFKPVLKQIIIQPPPQQTPIIKLIQPSQNSTYNSLKIIQPQGLAQPIPLGNMNLNQSSQSLISKHQVSPLSFVYKKTLDETKQSVTPFELNKSDQKNDENTSPYKRDSHWRVDQLLQAIQQPQTQQHATTSQNALVDLNFNSLKPMSSQMQIKSSTLKLQKVPSTQNDQENANTLTKSGVRFQNVEADEDKMYTPPRVNYQKQDNWSNKGGQDLKSNETTVQSVSIKEQFDYFDSVLQKQLNLSQSRNQKVQIKNILSQQDQSDQKGQLQPVAESNEDEYKYSKNIPNSTKNNVQHQKTPSVTSNIVDNNQVRASTQQFSSNTIKFNETTPLDGICRDNTKEKAPQSCYQSEIKPQDQIEESSFIQQISFLNQKIELTDQIREQKVIQQELQQMQEEQQRVQQRQNSTSPNRNQSQQMQQNQQNQNKGVKSILSQQSQQGLVAINNQVLQPKNQLKVITNQLQYCEEQMQKNKNLQPGFTGSGQLKTIAQLPTGQTYYYFQPQGAILYQQQHNSPIKHLQKDLINTHSLDAGLISPNNNQITYYRNQSPISNQLELPISFTHRENIPSGQLNIQQEQNATQIRDNKIMKQNSIQQQQESTYNHISNKNAQYDQSFLTDVDNVRMASVKVANSNLSPVGTNDIYYHQPQWNTKESDFLFSQNMQNRILDARLQDDTTAPQTPPSKKSQIGNNNCNTNQVNQSKNNSSISSAYTFNQKAYENRSEKHKVKHFTLKIDSVKKEIVNSDQFTDSAMAKDSTLNLTDQKQFKKDQYLFDPQQDSQSQSYSPQAHQKNPTDLIKKIENIQDNVRRSILKSNELNDMLSQTLNATSTHDSKKQFSNYCEGQEEVELEPYPDEQQNVASNGNNTNTNVNQSEKSPIRRSKIKIYHGKIEHIKISQQYQPENLVLYKFDEQLNALIPVVLDSQQIEQGNLQKDIQTQEQQLQHTNQLKQNEIFNSHSPIKSYEDLLREQRSGRKDKIQDSSISKKYNFDDVIMQRNSRSSSGDKNSSQKYKNNMSNSKQLNDSSSKPKYFQHQFNPDIKDNAYHQVLRQYSDKMLHEISKSMLVPNSYQQQHLNQKLYKQKQATQINQSLSSSKKQKFM